MIPVTILYDEYIDRPKLSEQKNICVFSSFPTSGVGTMIYLKLFLKGRLTLLFRKLSTEI